MDMQAFNEQIIAEFRANEGRVAMFADYPMVILHTLGSRTGTLRLVPLVLTINDGGMLLFASFAGAKKIRLGSRTCAHIQKLTLRWEQKRSRRGWWS